MAKADLFKEAQEKGLIPEDANVKNYTVAQLEKLLNPSEDGPVEEVAEAKELSLFEKAVKIKAVPTGAKEENYSSEQLAELVKRKNEADAAYKQTVDFENSQKTEE